MTHNGLNGLNVIKRSGTSASRSVPLRLIRLIRCKSFSSLRLRNHSILDVSDPFNLDAHDTSRGQKARRSHGAADAGGGACRYHVARFEREGGGEMLDLGEAVEDQLARVRVLAQLAVDPCAQLEGVRIADLV